MESTIIVYSSTNKITKTRTIQQVISTKKEKKKYIYSHAPHNYEFITAHNIDSNLKHNPSSNKYLNPKYINNDINSC